MDAAVNIAQPATGGTYIKQVITIGFFFFIFGFVTWVNGTLIPYLRIACELEEWQAYLVTFAFYISYTFMALPSSRILQLTGIIKGMQVGLLIMAAGCLLFVPAAMMRYYPLFLLGLFVVGAGTTLLQTAVNPYITKLGDPARAAQRMSIMGICNKFAGILAPMILGAIILKNSDGLLAELESLAPAAKTVRLDELARDVIMPYIVLTIVLCIIAFSIKYAHLPEITPSEKEPAISPANTGQGHNAAFILGFMAIFVSVAAEVIAGDTIGNYGIYHGVRLDVAKSLTSWTLASMLTGYVLGALFIPKLISQEKAFLYSSLLGTLLTLLAVFVPGQTSIVFIALLGFANAMLWPAIWPLALRGLTGALLNRGSAILIMGIAGGALLPLVYSWLSHISNDQLAYLLLVPCYLFNVYYQISRTKKQIK
ncbi:glucose/galactose MFS transporter [Chitinophaga cymbidii]|uniref:Glucose/galactose MFS transporter n=1 Tax=Chitinophaga cymbidii TaxID=1096750 RepID=A0A512RLK1_9BACT|nr:glucose/galactose MFS transporter [Chitinophaga cymbidii]GEP96581.1 glucose/galactose MFS transporter [Chitinophaga cymbidii]